MKRCLVACSFIVISGCGSAVDESSHTSEPGELASSASSATVAPPSAVPLQVSVGKWGSTYASASFVQVDWVTGQAEPTILFTMP